MIGEGGGEGGKRREKKGRVERGQGKRRGRRDRKRGREEERGKKIWLEA